MRNNYIAFSLFALLALGAFSPMRLHVLANSDSSEDQAVKLMVRDAIIDEMQPKLEKASTKSMAREILEESKEDLEQAANNVLKSQGFTYTAAISSGFEYYPDRLYGDKLYPQGVYEGIKIRLGEGIGKNWWCVMYPPLCIGEDNAKSGKVEFRSAIIDFIQKNFLKKGDYKK